MYIFSAIDTTAAPYSNFTTENSSSNASTDAPETNTTLPDANVTDTTPIDINATTDAPEINETLSDVNMTDTTPIDINATYITTEITEEINTTTTENDWSINGTIITEIYTSMTTIIEETTEVMSSTENWIDTTNVTGKICENI